MNKVPLLLLPGLLCDARLWTAQIAALAGRADAVVGDTTMDDRLEDMAARLLDDMPRRFAVAGHSMGGYLAMAVQRLAPERVTGLALVGTGARPDTQDERRRREGLLRLSRVGRFKGMSRRLLATLLHPRSLADPRIVETVFQMAEDLGRDVYEQQQHAIMARPDARPGLAQVRVPTLILTGEEDRVTPPGLAREMAAIVPGARLRILPECGHLPPLEQPHAVSAALASWLDDVGHAD